MCQQRNPRRYAWVLRVYKLRIGVSGNAALACAWTSFVVCALSIGSPLLTCDKLRSFGKTFPVYAFVCVGVSPRLRVFRRRERRLFRKVSKTAKRRPSDTQTINREAGEGGGYLALTRPFRLISYAACLNVVTTGPNRERWGADWAIMRQNGGQIGLPSEAQRPLKPLPFGQPS